MTIVATSLVLAWVLGWFAIVGIWTPLAAFGSVGGRRAMLLQIGPALVCSWLTLAVGVPLAAALGVFNWVTAILLAAVCPAGLWLHRHRGAYSSALQRQMRSFVMDVITLAIVRRFGRRRWLLPITAVSMLVLWVLIAGSRDVRLPVPADFDALWRTRQILSGTGVWDPLAALAAVLTRISAANALYVAGAMRLALVALTGLAAVILVCELGRWRFTPLLLIAPLALPLAAPPLPVAAWGIALSVLTASTSFVLWLRTRRSREGWFAVAALALALGVAQPFAGSLDRLTQVGSSARYLEHPAAARQALLLDRTVADVDWLLVGPPEQQLEIEKGRFLDLARFVSRFSDRAADPNFRFDLGAERIYVFVEERPLDDDITAVEGEFVAAQPVSYRVPRERFRLARLARRICDDYRRTHPGAVITYDDGALRVYQINR